jgi:hypothetical protein
VGIRNYIVFLALLFIFQGIEAQETNDFPVQNIPSSIEEFVQLRNNLARTPEGGAVCFVLAMLVYEQDRVLGLSCFTVTLDNSPAMLMDNQQTPSYKGKSPSRSTLYLIERLQGKPWISRSYIKGTTPQEGYRLQKDGLVLQIGRNPYSVIDDRTIKVFVNSSGAASPRPIRMAKNDAGIWKVAEFSSLVVDVQAPLQGDGDNL